MRLRGLRAIGVSAAALAATCTGLAFLVPAGVGETPETAAATTQTPADPASDTTPATDAVRATELSRNEARPELATAAEARATALGAQVQQINTNDASMKAAAAAHAAALANFRSTQGYDPGTTDPKSMAQQIMANKYGWGADQFQCYNNIIMRESKWDTFADNPTSSAYGIPQALPGSKMASFGSDWKTNPATQIKWGLWYVSDRYGTPCQAWSFKSGHGWY